MKIGDKVSVRPQTFGGKTIEGRMVYVHPKERFAVVEFEIEQKGPRWLQKPGKIRLRESFFLTRKEEKR